MSSASSISRIQSPAERGSRRSDRPAAGDFAALLDALPEPARGPVRAPAERSRHERPADPARSRSADRRSDDAATRGHGREPAASPRGAEAQAEPLAGAVTASEPAPAAPPAAMSLTTPATAVPAAPAGIAAPPAADRPALLVPAIPPVAPTTTTGSEPATPSLAFAPAGPSPAAAPSTPTTPAETGVSGAVPVAPSSPPSAVPPPAGEAPVAAAPSGVPVAAGESVAIAPEALAAAPSGAAAHDTPVADPAAQGTAATSNGVAGGDANSPGGRDGGEDGAADGEPAPAAPAPGPPVAAPAAAAPATGRLLEGTPLGAHSAVPLERAPRAVAQLLRVGAEGGVSHARIALRPVELGGIEIFLQVGPAGLTAQVIAESPEAARMLQQAGEDLRRSLAGHDVELVSLDVSTSSEHSQRDDLRSREGLADFGDATATPRRSGAADSEAAESTSPVPTVLELPDGLLVDVLA